MSEEQAISNAFICSNILQTLGSTNPPIAKKKRNLPGNPDPEAEVVALTPKTLTATNRFSCEVCGKGFQREQNLQLHRRGHNLPWKLKQRSISNNKLEEIIVRKRVYVCPEKSCVHNHPSRALGDLTGIKKHFFRKHGEKKWKCEKCSKKYAVHSDWKAHSKTCGTKHYKCDCGTPFSRRDSYVTHKAYCMALAEETARLNAISTLNNNNNSTNYNFNPSTPNYFFKPNHDHLTSQMFLNYNNLNYLKPTIGLPFCIPNSRQNIDDNDDNNYRTRFHHPFVFSVPNEKALFSGVFGSMNSNSIDQDSAAKRIKLTVSEESVNFGEFGQTRDFLGVGMPIICHPSSSAVNGWL